MPRKPRKQRPLNKKWITHVDYMKNLPKEVQAWLKDFNKLWEKENRGALEQDIMNRGTRVVLIINNPAQDDEKDD